MIRLFLLLYFIALSLHAKEPFFGSGLHHSLQLVTGDWVEAEVDMETPEQLQLKRAFYPLPRQMGELAQGWHFNVPDLGEAASPRVKFAPPDDYQFLYQYDDQKRLIKVELATKERVVVSSFDITYENNTCTVVSSSGDKVCYGLSKSPIGGNQLDWIQKSDGYFCEYIYAPHLKERKLLLKERREKGGAWTKLTYFDSGKIKELFQSHDCGKSYQLFCTLDYEEHATTVIDALGAINKYFHDGNEKIYKIETYTPDLALYKIQEYEWSEEFLVRSSVLDPFGRVLLEEKWTYDLMGNLIEEQCCDSPKKSYTYINGRLTEEREEDGPTYIYSYDSHGRLASREGTSYVYDEEGRLISTIMEGGLFEKTLEFSPQNHPLRQVKGYLDHEIEETLFSYNSKGKLLQKTIRNLLNGDEEWTAYTYSQEGKITEITTSQGEITRFLEREKRHFQNNIETVSTYSNEGNLILEETYKKGKLIDSKRYTYGPCNLVLSVEDQGGNKTLFTYDCFGRLIEEILPPVEGIFAIKSYSYNILDQRVIQTDPMGNSTRITYNTAGKPLLIEFPDGSVEEKHYFKNGLLKSEISRNKTWQDYEYDVTGRMIQKRSPAEAIHYTYQGIHLAKESRSSGLEICHSYDTYGRLTASTSTSGRKVTYEYNERGELASQKEWISGSEAIEIPLPEKQESKEVEDPITQYIVNSFGQFVKEETIRLPGGSNQVLTYDARGQVEKAEIFSQDGNLLDRHLFSYDLNGRKIQEIAGNSIYEWSYDCFGNVTRSIEGYHLYNSLGQLEKDILQDGREICYIYNSLERLEKVYSSDSTISYTLFYDDAGRISKIIDEIHGLITLREYNGEGQLAKETLGNGLVIQNQYDLLGRRTKITLPDASSVDYHYEGSHCASIERGHYSYRYLERDKLGRPLKTSMIADLGEITFERLNGRCISTSSPYYTQTATLDEEGRVITLKDQEERSFAYDGLSQLICEHPSFDLEYDLNGNLIRKSDLTFSYDALNRLTKVEKEGKLLHHYVYDLFHRRIIDQSHRFLYDGNWEMGRYGVQNEAIELRIFENPQNFDHGACIAFELSGEVFAPLYDLFGSVACLISTASKEICASYRYTPFGECQSEEKGINNPWRFSNKRQDEESGLVFFGRRDYSPELSRFITKDPLGFSDGTDLYAYLHNNPLNAIDLFGLKSFSQSWTEALQKGADVFKNFFVSIGTSIKSWFSKFFQKVKQIASSAMNRILHTVIGAGFLLLFAHYDTGPKSGVYGKGEVSDKVRVSFMNGILTEHDDLIDSLKAISESHGNVNVHFIHRQTKGWFSDMLSGFLVQLGFISPDAHELAGEWKKMIQEMGGVNGGGKIIHYAHSIGAMETLRALSLLTPEEKKMIEIYTFGSPSLSTKDPDAHVRHFASIRDGVCLIDIISFIKAAMGKLNNVVFVGNLWGGLPFIDHLFASQSYQDLWKSMGRTFVEWYGTI